MNADPLAAPGVALDAAGLIALRRVSLRADAPRSLAALPGGFVTRKRGHGLEVADLRAYAEGDDIRHLDRAATARTGEPHIRTFQEERDRALLLVADFRPSMLWGLRRAFRSVAAAEALTILGWRAVEAGGRVGLVALSAGPPVIVPVRGRAAGMLAVIGGMVRAHDAALQMALGGARDDPALEEGLTRIERIAPRGAEIALASGFDGAGAALDDRLAALARRHDLRLLAISDGLTDRLPPGTYPIRLPDGTRRHARIGGGTARDADAPAGLPVLRLDAGEAPEATARRLAEFEA